MRFGRGLQAVLALAWCGAAAADAQTPGVAVFTLSSIPVRADGATVHELDRRDRIVETLGADLPADPEAALAEARRRLDSSERDLRSDLAEAAAGNALAARLGIEKLPAVVVDGRYVVYGARDVARAVERVAAWRAENEEPVDSGPGNARSTPFPHPGTPPARSLSGERQP